MYFRAKLGLAICSLLSPKLLMCFEFNCCFVHDSASCQNSVATKVKRRIPLEKWEKLLSLQHITAACTSWIIRMICNRSIIYYFWGNYANTHCSWQAVFTLICVGVPRPQFWQLHLEKALQFVTSSDSILVAAPCSFPSDARMVASTSGTSPHLVTKGKDSICIIVIVLLTKTITKSRLRRSITNYN